MTIDLTALSLAERRRLLAEIKLSAAALAAYLDHPETSSAAAHLGRAGRFLGRGLELLERAPFECTCIKGIAPAVLECQSCGGILGHAAEPAGAEA